MRTSSALFAALALAGCGGAGRPEGDGGLAGTRIACAATGDALATRCSVERAAGQPDMLILHRSDGGFHRVRVVRDGRGIVAADGAEAARVDIVGDGQIEVAIGGMRYRLPATVMERG